MDLYERTVQANIEQLTAREIHRERALFSIYLICKIQLASENPTIAQALCEIIEGVWPEAEETYQRWQR